MIKRLSYLCLLFGGLIVGLVLVRQPQLLEKRAAVTPSDSTLYFIHQDQLGSTSLITDATGAAVSRLAYYPYGSTRSSEGDSPTQREYTGQISDTEETGLYYYNARYYHPTIGKFTQADTAGSYLNRYLYVGNNPVNKIDPTGHDDWWRDEAQNRPGAHAGGGRVPPISASAPQASLNDIANILGIYLAMLSPIFAPPVTPLIEAVDTALCVAGGGGPECVTAAAPGYSPVVGNAADDVGDELFGAGSGGLFRKSTYKSAGGQKLVIDPQNDELLMRHVDEWLDYLETSRPSNRTSRGQLVYDFITSKMSYSQNRQQAIYQSYGNRAPLGVFASKHCVGVCREMGALAHVDLAYSGLDSWMVTAEFRAEKHAWAEYFSKGTRMVVDPAYEFFGTAENAYELYRTELGQMKNIKRFQFVGAK